MAWTKIENNIRHNSQTGRYQVTLYFGRTEKGDLIRERKNVGSLREARTLLRKHETERDQNALTVPNKITLNKWLDYWVENISAVTHRTTTRYGYNSIIENHIRPALGHLMLQQIKVKDIQEYYRDLGAVKGLSPNTIIKHHDLLRSIFLAALRFDYISRSPLERVVKPKKNKYIPSVLSADQVVRILEEVEGDPFEIIIALAAYLGLRRGEILGLTWKQVNMVDKYLAVVETRSTAGNKKTIGAPKSEQSIRILTIEDGLYKILLRWKRAQKRNMRILGDLYHDSDYVTTREDGSLWNPNYVSSKYHEITQRLEIRSNRLHDLRHTFASLANDLGNTAYDIGRALGHSSTATTTDIYTHLLEAKRTRSASSVGNTLDQELKKRRK